MTREKITFEEIVKKYDKRLFNTIYWMIGDYEEAQDITQETFLLIYKALPKFRGESDVFTWIYRIAVNQCKRFRRKQKTRKFFSLDEKRMEVESTWSGDLGIEKNPVKGAEWREMSRILREKVSSLPEYYKEAMILRYFYGYSYEEIGKTLKIPLGTVRSRLARGRKELMEKLKDLDL
jgi:RNA polymerase sigma-70 factor (ECF subfamily)